MNRNVGRMLVVGFTFLILAPPGFSAAWAAEARIEGFMFECRAPDGKKLKPKFGDVDGTLFIDLPNQRGDCIATVDRGMNTSFISNTRDREYAGCLPIFEQQAKLCAAHFRDERPKCNAGGSGAATPEAGEAAVAGDVPGPLCSDVAEGPCWNEVSNRPGCYIRLSSHSDPSWSGGCVDGKASGRGRVELPNGAVGEGQISAGKLEGRWVVRYADGDVAEGPYVAGKREGRWVWRFADGQVGEGGTTTKTGSMGLGLFGVPMEAPLKPNGAMASKFRNDANAGVPA